MTRLPSSSSSSFSSPCRRAPALLRRLWSLPVLISIAPLPDRPELLAQLPPHGSTDHSPLPPLLTCPSMVGSSCRRRGHDEQASCRPLRPSPSPLLPPQGWCRAGSIADHLSYSRLIRAVETVAAVVVTPPHVKAVTHAQRPLARLGLRCPCLLLRRCPIGAAPCPCCRGRSSSSRCGPPRP